MGIKVALTVELMLLDDDNLVWVCFRGFEGLDEIYM